MSFGQRIEEFYSKLHLDVSLPSGFEVIQPFHQLDVQSNLHAMAVKYYVDAARPRLAIWGINPGRLGGGQTGLPFTDPHALHHLLHIGPDVQLRREPSATFIQTVIEEYGGAIQFYHDVYLSAVCPLGFTRGGNNINFYDDLTLKKAIIPFVLKSMHIQIQAGLKTEACIVLGSGALRKFFEKEVLPEIPYKHVEYLDHPRFIMQYRRSAVREYVTQYVRTIRTLLEK